MGSNIIELAKLGHERASELKASCCAVDVRSLAQLISDLATQLEVQLVRGNAQAVQLANAESKCREMAAENSALKYQEPTLKAMMACLDAFCADEDVPERAMMAAYNILRKSIGTPDTDAILAEMRAQGVEMAITHIEQTISPNHETVLNEYAAKIRQEAAK